MAIATTTSRSNVEALLGAHLGPRWEDGFAAVVCAEEALRKKPDPQAYLEVLRRLGRAPSEVLAVEDSSPGVSACRAAGVAVVVTRSVYFAQADTRGALAVGPGLGSVAGWHLDTGAAAAGKGGATGRVDLDCLRRWFAARAG